MSERARRGASSAVGVALTCIASFGRAEANIWTRAANPEAAAVDDAVAEARRLLDRPGVRSEGRSDEGAAERLEEASRILANAPLAARTNVAWHHSAARVERARFDADGDTSHLDRASIHLRFVVAHGKAAPTELVAASLFELAVAYAHLGRRREEIAAYAADLAIEPHPLHRSLVFANLADAQMNLRDLRAAKRSFGEALDLIPTSVVGATGITTMWGLAVAQDRSGDLPRAIETVALARSYDPTDAELRSPNWFFVPVREAHWYAALGHASRAYATDDPALRADAFKLAETSMAAYASACPPDDAWLTLARERGRHFARQAEKARASAR